MLAEVALAAVILFPWSLLLVPLGVKLLGRWRCALCLGVGRVERLYQGAPGGRLERCPTCRGWGHVSPWRQS